MSRCGVSKIVHIAMNEPRGERLPMTLTAGPMAALQLMMDEY